MFCPNCSSEAPAHQKFCRACGMELHAVAELVSGQSAIAKPDDSTGKSFKMRHRAIIIWGFVLTFGAIGVGAALKILAKEGIHPAGEFTPYVSVVSVLLALFGLGLMCYPFLEMIWPGHERPQASSARSPSTARVRPELLAEEPLSVTEQTTELLAQEARPGVPDASPEINS